MSSSTSNSRSANTYLMRVLPISIFLLLVVAGFNWLIDPLYLFNSPQIDSLNSHKPSFVNNQHLVKPQWARQSDASILILGTSRAGNGLNPQHPALASATTFNYGLPGSRIGTTARLFDDAASSLSIDTAILTLDFFAFNAVPSAVDSRDAALFPLLIDDGDKLSPAQWFETNFAQELGHLLTLEGVRRSVSTIRSQQRALSGVTSTFTLYRNGHWQQTLPANRSQLEQIRQTERLYMASSWFPAPSRQFAFDYEGRSVWEEYAELIRSLQQETNSSILLISPLHARFQSALNLVGLQERFEAWKRELVRVNSSVAAELGKPPLALWDFADFSELNQEAIPPQTASDQRMQYFLDGQHYTAVLGNIVLDRIFARENELAGNFGRLLSTDNIDDHLLLLRERQQAYASSHPADMEDLQASFDSIQ